MVGPTSTILEIEYFQSGFLDADDCGDPFRFRVGDDMRRELSVNEDPDVLSWDPQVDSHEESTVDDRLGLGHLSELIITRVDVRKALEAEVRLREVATVIKGLNEQRAVVPQVFHLDSVYACRK